MTSKHSNFYSDIVDCAKPCYIIAEAGINHNGDVKRACQLIDVACQSEANAVKFQTFIPDDLLVNDASLADYQRQNVGNQLTQYEMLSDLQLQHEEHRKLFSYCNQNNIDFLSTPFEEKSGDFLHSLDVKAFKIPSGEITNLPFLSHMAEKQKPIILSTGMSSLGEVEAAVEVIEKQGNKEIIILHCVSQYPAPFDDLNLTAMETLNKAFGYPIGFSDHSIGIEASLAAVALGARVIEKHFTLSRSFEGPDHKASLEPNELKALVHCVRNIEKALGNGRKIQQICEENTVTVARKSIVAKKIFLQGRLSL